jgi:flagellar assembly protein FliH
MSDPVRRASAGSGGASSGEAPSLRTPVGGAAWTPPTVAGPLVTFRGRQTSAAGLDEELRAARDAGFERGRSEGLASAAAEIAQRLQDLDARRALFDGLVHQLVEPMQRLDADTVAELARLAVLVGSQLARRELALDPRQVIAIIRECLSSLPGSARDVKIRLHPADARIVGETVDTGPAGGRTAAELSGTPTSGWSLVEDASMSRGGCCVEAEASRIDARLETRVAAAMVAILGDERGDPRGESTPPPRPELGPTPPRAMTTEGPARESSEQRSTGRKTAPRAARPGNRKGA